MNKFSFPVRNPDIIFLTSNMFKSCTAPTKVNLSIGIYADYLGKTTTEKNQYLGIKGDQRLVKFTNKLLFNSVPESTTNKFHTLQTCGGTGALSMVASCLRLFSSKENNIIIPQPSWANHCNIFEKTGNIFQTPYMKKNKIAFLEDVKKINNEYHNILLLQTSCHNPTGIDLHLDEWDEVFDVCEKKDITLIMDSAYIGMGNGISKDIEPVVRAFKKNIDLFVCVSYSKIASLYGHRLGLMYFKPKEQNKNIPDNFEYLSRISQSNPPRMGSDILLQKYENNPKKLELEIQDMADRIKTTRKILQYNLNKYNIFDFERGNGMFSLLPFNEEQIAILRNKYNIFVLPNGRINICGVNDINLDYVTDAFSDVTQFK
jgi:aspartate/tyrosine/aromatic aminotransferase